MAGDLLDPLTEEDVKLLISESDWREHCGEIEIPKALADLARRISIHLGDTALIQRCTDRINQIKEF